MAIEEKDRDDVMDRLLQLGGDKKFLSYDDLNRELPENVVSPDDIEDVLQKLDASNIHVADSDERLIEQAAAIATDDEESGDDDLELIFPRARSRKPTTRCGFTCARWAWCRS